MIVAAKMPARPCIDQLLKERYLFVLAHLALFVSDELVDQLQKTHLPRESLYRYITTEVHLSSVMDQLPAIARFPERGSRQLFNLCLEFFLCACGYIAGCDQAALAKRKEFTNVVFEPGSQG